MPLETTEIVALIGATAVVSGVVSGFVTSSRSLYINAITVERNKWIDKLRSNISAFATEARAFSVDFGFGKHNHEKWKKMVAGVGEGQPVPKEPIFGTDKFVEHFRKLQDLSHTIQLQLNPDGVIDADIISLLKSPAYYDVSAMKRINRSVETLIRHSQWLLKAEWEKVKYEGASWIYRNKHQNDEREWVARYTAWLEANGGLDLSLDDAEPDQVA